MTTTIIAATDTVDSWSPDSVMLFQEDLSVMADILGGSEGSSNVAIADRERNYLSFDELRGVKGDEVHELYLGSLDHRVRVNFSKAHHKVTVITSASGDKAELIFLKLKDFLLKKERPMTSWWVPALQRTAWAILLIAAVPVYRNRNVGGLVGLASISATVIPILMLAFASDMKKQTQYFVTLKRRHEYQPFLKRNKDALILMLLGSIIGAILGILGTLVVQRLAK